MLCERDLGAKQKLAENSEQAVNLSTSVTTWRQHCGPNRSFVVCPQGHTTHTFLACDRQAHCGQDRYVSHCPFFDVSCDAEYLLVRGVESTWSVPMFTCDDDVTTIPYSLVCDFHSHCPDRSDESFCLHHKCGKYQFHCENGQCLDQRDVFLCCFRMRCTIRAQCLDKNHCSWSNSVHWGKKNLDTALAPPAIIDLQERYDGFETTTSLITTMQLAENDSCPDTHFRCLGKLNYCMPVYMRCNGYKDCLGGEDEQGCQGSACPGFYRCRGSNVCLHADHVCDGFVQCPQHDDEWMCQETPICPQPCLCQGLSFACIRPFNFDLLPQLRYLDIKNISVNISQLTQRQRQYLISLMVNDGFVRLLPEAELPNLRFLDLSRNNIEVISSSVLFKMPNLRTLSLSNNPLELLFSQHNSANGSSSLQSLDLRNTTLRYFDSRLLAFLRSLRHLDISRSSLQRVDVGGFRNFTQLRTLNLRGTHLRYYPADLFAGLKNLERVFSPDYRLCCSEMLPAISIRPDCVADESSLSSCDDLLRSRTHVVALLTQGLLAVMGSAFCAFIRHFKYREQSQSMSFAVLMTNLNVANFLTGVYAIAIASADFHFRGQFLKQEDTWKSSSVCHVVGFVSALSHQTSSLLVLVITLDRVLTLHGPTLSSQLHLRSAAVSGVLAWCAGTILATVPYVTDHSGLYGISAMCVPLPGHFRESFVFGVHVVLQTVFVLLVFSGQVIISRPPSPTLINSPDSGTDRTELARLFVPLATVHCLRGAVLGCTGYVSFNSRHVMNETLHINLAIFLQHIDAACNPCLYIGNRISENQRKKTQQKLLTILKRRVQLDLKDE